MYYNEYDEEEMLQLASEMSLYDVILSSKSKWTESDFAESRNALNNLKDLLVGAEKELEKSKERLLSSPNGEDEKESFQYAFDSPRPVLPSMIRDSAVAGFPEVSPRTPHLVRRKSTSEGIPQKLVQELSSASSKVRYFHKKLSQAIEHCPADDPNILNFLELNDDVTALLGKVKEVVPQSHDMSVFEANAVANGPIGWNGAYSEDLLYLSHEREFGDVEHHEDEINSPEIADIMYIMSRNSNREEMSQAINKLLHRFCSCHQNEKIESLKVMQKVGVLTTLLLALPRCQEWPEVAMQVSKAISILVTYEENWYILRRCAYDILNSLRILQIKSNLRAGISTVVHRANPIGSYQAPPPVSIDPSEIDSTPAGRLHALEQLRDVRGLVSAALAKLATVLCNDWGKDININCSCDPNYCDKVSGLTRSGSSDNMMSLQQPYHTTSEFCRILTIMLDIVVAVNRGAKEIAAIPSPKSRHDCSGCQTTGTPHDHSHDHDHAHSHDHSNHSSIKDGVESPAVPNKSGSHGCGENCHCDLSVKALVKVDRPSVISSIALCNLCELPESRPCLASAGVIEVLRDWIDVGSDLLAEVSALAVAQANKLKAAEEASLSPTSREELVKRPSFMLSNIDDVGKEADSEVGEINGALDGAWAQANELINNAAAVVMYLLGGSADCRLVQPGPKDRLTPVINKHARTGSMGSLSAKNAHSSSSQGSGDVIVGWIDSQVLNDGLPSALVRYVNTAVESAATLKHAIVTINACSSDPSFGFSASAILCHKVSRRCDKLAKMKDLAFPRAAGIHVAQAFFLLSSRSHNRSHLLSIQSPAAMNALLVNSVTQHKEDVDDGAPSLGNSSHDFNSLLLQYGQKNEWSKVDEQFGFEVWDRKSRRIKQQQAMMQEIAASTAAQCCGSCGDEESFAAYGESDPDHISSGLYMMSVASACSDAFTYLLVDAAVASGTNANPMQASPAHYQTGSHKNAGSGIVTLMCESLSIESIKYLLSILPRGHCRLSTLRVVSALSDWPVGREALFKGDITDALVLISSEAEELHKIKMEKREKEYYGFHAEVGRVDKDKKSLDTSNSKHRRTESLDHSAHSTISNSASKLSAITSPKDIVDAVVSTFTSSASSVASNGLFGGLPHSLSIQNPSTLLPAASSHGGSTSSKLFDKLEDIEMTPASTTNRDHVDDGRQSFTSSHGLNSARGGAGYFVDQEEEETKAQKVAEEETMTVCCALANFCRASKQYVERMFDNGLLSIMLQLVKSSNMEISRQSLRCICAICQIIASSPTDKVGASRQSKSQLYHDIMLALNAALMSDISVMMREAVVGIANLAPDESLHYEIMEKCFKKVVGFLLDHQTDADTKNAAEKVLINCSVLILSV
jgi:hypothetical protein